MEAAIFEKTGLITSTFHQLPCRIYFEGNGQVETYFLTELDRRNQLTSTLRGRGLKGLRSRAIANYTNVFVKRDRDQKWIMESKSDEANIWSHDDHPTRFNSASCNVAAWTQIAEAVHSLKFIEQGANKI